MVRPHAIIPRATRDGMLAGLGAAHRAGLVHRDLSPQIVVLNGAGDGPIRAEMARIVDLGLADRTGRSTVGTDVLLAGGVAGAGGVVGQAAFMSPEQAQGRPVRSVSDLYQAGAVLYFLLTAQPPFPRRSTEQVLAALVSAPPPVPSALVPSARRIDRVVTRALAKTPARRFRDAEEFRAALADAIREPDPVRAPEGGSEPTGVTRMLPSAPDGEPLGYLSPVVAPEPHPATARSGGGVAAGIVGIVILALAGWGRCRRWPA